MLIEMDNTMTVYTSVNLKKKRVLFRNVFDLAIATELRMDNRNRI